MRDLPSCLGEYGVKVADASCSSVDVNTKPSQNSATCIYKCKLFDKLCLVSIVWGKNLVGQSLSVEILDAFCNYIYRVDVKLSLFSKRKGSKSLEMYSGKIELFWDLSTAKFGFESGFKPLEGYYIGVVYKGVMVLLVGDMTKEAFKRSGAIASFCSGTLISKREHIFGKRVFTTKAQFCDNGKIHEVKIEYEAGCVDDPALVVCVDSKTVMQVRHLTWKFRGNSTILVDGLLVDVFWDVYKWLFGGCNFYVSN